MAVEEEIAHLVALNIEGLREAWLAKHGQRPPAHLSARLLQSRLIYDLQVQRFGGLDRIKKQRLTSIAARLEKDPDAPIAMDGAPVPGTRLIREWSGERHIVEVLNSGFAYKGTVYASLSEIARLITGARWSGPRFFGLKKRVKAS